ncbi:hypothetical protein HG531_006632 [Fusarium graminearum]|nr:hypothetical protein HG531_006632 [Fusarium graminearum]
MMEARRGSVYEAMPWAVETEVSTFVIEKAHRLGNIDHVFRNGQGLGKGIPGSQRVGESGKVGRDKETEVLEGEERVSDRVEPTDNLFRLLLKKLFESLQVHCTNNRADLTGHGLTVTLGLRDVSKSLGDASLETLRVENGVEHHGTDPFNCCRIFLGLNLELDHDAVWIAEVAGRVEGITDSVSLKLHNDLLKADLLTITHDVRVEEVVTEDGHQRLKLIRDLRGTNVDRNMNKVGGNILELDE